METDIVKHFFTGTGSSYDSIVNLFTYGADRYWKKKLLAKVPKSRKILDLACGTGIVAFKLAKMNPCCKIVGVDMMWEYLVEAKKKTFLNNCSEVQLICARAEDVQGRMRRPPLKTRVSDELKLDILSQVNHYRLGRTNHEY